MAVLYPNPTNWSEHQVPIGRERTYGEGTDLTIVTFGNGLHMSLRVARRLDSARIFRPSRRHALARPATHPGHRA